MSHYSLLVNSLKLLNLPYEDQRKILPDFVSDIQDDIVSDFDNSFMLLPQLTEQEKVSYEAVKLILNCYVLIEMNLSNPELPERAFENHKSWARVRDLAKQALSEMKEELSHPDNIGID
ncbi:MAG: hypothetical protein AAF705_00590 [Bacteroidota bacterium]